MIWYFYMHRYKQWVVIDIEHTFTYKTAYTDTCKTYQIVTVNINRLPENEPSVSKHVEDIKTKN